MEDIALVGNPIYSTQLNTFAIPNDSGLKRAYDVYKPSPQTLRLQSEQGRSIYPEVFIENSNLGTLVDLCVRVLARTCGPQPTPIIASSPLLLQVHYDSLDVDLPLAECYSITEERFWKRVVLTKHRDKTLAIQRNVNWRNLGISLKYVELVEECPVEYWPEDEMKELALKVKEFVTEMHIKRLQSLKDRSFEKYFKSETESTSEESSLEEEFESLLTSSSEEEEAVEGITMEKTSSQLELENKKAERKKERQNLREAKEKAREDKEEAKRKRRETRRSTEEKPVKKVLKKIPDSVFDIELSESEDDGEDRIIDKRNKSLLLRHKKKYNYPDKDCHHIDLKFVQYFTNLETLTIEFFGPLQNRNYHKRHQSFSYVDIKNLAIGLSHLHKLKTFRLRNSRMDANKCLTLCRSLRLLPNLETLDFGNDRLLDDCGLAFEKLFKCTKSLRNLELESNNLGEQALLHLGKALKNYQSNNLLYLGLARNPIEDKALHYFVSNIVGSKHIEELNIRGLKSITDSSLSCCIANELKQHLPLIKLDICAIQISPTAADKIVKSLAENKKILELYCCGCELDIETEIDINVLLKRNKYIAENYYLGNSSITNEEITKWMNRTRNPILLKVLAEKENDKECLQNRSKEIIPSPYFNSPAQSSHSSLNIVRAQMYERQLEENSSIESSELVPQTPERFVYSANDFDEQQFLEHVAQPGPQQRYYYFKKCKKNYLIKDNIKNISMI